MARGAVGWVVTLPIGKFKTKRGGGRSFSRNLQLDENGTAVSMDRRRRDKDEDSEDDSEEKEEEEESEDEDDGPSSGLHNESELSRLERKELKRKQAALKSAEDGEEEEEEDELLVNPNRVTKKMTISELNEPRQLTRRERFIFSGKSVFLGTDRLTREVKEKQEAKDRYWKLHLEGKTEQAKTDLARLAKIRQEREAAQAKRKAEAEGEQPAPPFPIPLFFSFFVSFYKI
ncbi:hypothetical protein EW146_g10162 [Bondarzewia mesenterica]|uniref:Casein kinase substrate phosphoprotein PP28 domain-containing protein n=1 Tax=Bondarzewia mesenterica TaxID=1095465 RepID=A0A4S4L164_9AGAM|nr:hypothetical protein EW146_g10162 [Bondarzewia mesenterica]